METRVHELVDDSFTRRDVADFGLQVTDYGRALDHLVIANVDVVVHQGRSRVLLGYRKDLPLRDQFWVFGGRMKPGESIIDTASRVLLREIGLKTERDRFAFDHIYNAMWATRNAPPEERGYQTLLTLLTYGCTEDEVAAVAAADTTHGWVRWYSPAELRELHASGSDLLHPFLPIVLRNAGMY